MGNAQKQQLKFIDLFSGIGGFRTGMERADNQCVGYCEIDKFARQSYQSIYNTKGEWTATDINKVTNEEWRKLNETKGPINVICGGFPCQSFSIAGKRKGFKDKTRGTLFFEIARAAEQIKPQYLFLENVKGLLNHEKGDTFRTILSSLDELGYDVEWCVLNSKNFGVPQNRERVFIIGHLRGQRTREVFPEQGEDRISTNSEVSNHIRIAHKASYNAHNIYDAKGISPTLTATNYKHPIRIKYFYNARQHGEYGNKDVLDPTGISKTLETMSGGNRQPKIVVDTGIKYVYNSRRHGGYGTDDVLNPEGLSKTVTVGSGKQKIAIPILTPDRVKKRQNGRRYKENGDPMYTLTAQDRHGIITNGLRIRKLTPRECWRLQGYSDEAFNKAQKVVSNSQLYKQAGNSVTVPVIEWIARRLAIGEGEVFN